MDLNHSVPRQRRAMMLPALRRPNITAEQLERQRQELQESRAEYAGSYLSLMTGLWHLQPNDRTRSAWNQKFHVDVNGQGCVCCQCKPERWVELPKMSEPDKFLDNHEDMADQSESLFYGKVPAEIRLKIWKLMFAGFVTFRDEDWRNSARPDQWMNCIPTEIRIKRPVYHGSHATLLRTCRRIYSEILHIYYEENLFFFDMYLVPAVSCYRPNWLTMIQRVFLLGSRIHKPCDSLDLMPNLRSLVLIHPRYGWKHKNYYWRRAEAASWRDNWISGTTYLHPPEPLDNPLQGYEDMIRREIRREALDLMPRLVIPRDMCQIVIPCSLDKDDLERLPGEVLYAPNLEIFMAKFESLVI